MYEIFVICVKSVTSNENNTKTILDLKVNAFLGKYVNQIWGFYRFRDLDRITKSTVAMVKS